MTVDDNELPGMWERADFEGGDPGERSYAEREGQKAGPYLSFLGLFVERAIAAIYSRSESDMMDATEAADALHMTRSDGAAAGVDLLVRLALAAREWDKATDGLGTLFETGPAAALRRTVAELDEWEKSL